MLAHEFLVGAALDDPPAVHDEYLVGVAHRVQPMGYGHEGLAPRKLRKSRHEQVLVLRVDRARRLVEDDDRRVLHDGARDGHALALPSGEVRTALFENGVVPLRQLHDEVVAARPFRRGNHLVARGIRLSEPDVVLHGVVEQVHVLEDHRDAREKALGRPLAHIDASDAHASLVDVPEAREQVDERGLARSARTHERAGRAFGNGERHIVDRAAAAVVRERDALHREAEPIAGKRPIRRVLPRNRAHLVDAVELPLDLLGEEGAVVRADELAVDHEGGHQQRERPGEGERARQVQGARGEQDAAAGEVEDERVELQYALGCPFLLEVGPLLALEGGLRLRQRLVGLRERAQHRHPPSVFDHRVGHALLGGRYLAGGRGRAPAQPLEDDEPDRDPGEGDGRHRRRERQEEQAHDGRHGHAPRKARQADGHELLELVDGRGERRRDGGEALVGEVPHGGSLQPVANPETQIAEHMEALRVHLDVD